MKLNYWCDTVPIWGTEVLKPWNFYWEHLLFQYWFFDLHSWHRVPETMKIPWLARVSLVYWDDSLWPLDHSLVRDGQWKDQARMKRLKLSASLSHSYEKGKGLKMELWWILAMQGSPHNLKAWGFGLAHTWRCWESNMPRQDMEALLPFLHTCPVNLFQLGAHLYPSIAFNPLANVNTWTQGRGVIGPSDRRSEA